MTRNSLLTPIAVVGIAVLLIIALYLVVSDHKGSEENLTYMSDDTETSNGVQPNHEVEINLVKGIMGPGETTRIKFGTTALPPEKMPNIKVSFIKIPYNTKPAFNIGDRFEYHSTAPTFHSLSSIAAKNIQNTSEENISESSTPQVQAKTICSVIDKERLKGKVYFVVECSRESIVMGQITEDKNVYYISPENGEIKKVIHNEDVFYKDIKRTLDSFSTEIPSPNSEIYTAGFYSPWMLSLSDDFKMKIEVFQHPTIAREEIAVIGEEKIKNRECYLVEYRQMDKNNKVLLRKKEWIDKKKRILIKSEVYYENLRVSSTELASDIK